MKQSEHNEIDSLLRHLARSEGSVRAGSAKSIRAEPGLHLDADELSSYAEGALPPATRARYTSHLADCDDCRQMIVQLSLASGVVIKEDSGAQGPAARSNWKKILAAFFSPAVLRYAMPALAVVVVAFAFFAYQRQQRESHFEALNRQPDVPTATQTKEGGGAQQSAGDTYTQPGREARKVERPQSDAVKPMADEETGKRDSGNDKKAGDASTSVSSAGAGVAANETKAKDQAREKSVESQPAYAPESPPPPAAKPQPAVSNVEKAPVKAKEESAEARDAPADRTEADQSKGNVGSTMRGPAAKPAATRGKSGEPATAAGRSDDEVETRTLSGRRFQRRNGAWVDSAYNSSGATTNVARGSEQYRALVADEPEIAAIANQLSGEVFLVWKGHSYHIQ